MRYLAWFVRIVLFLLLFAFAIKNTDPVTLHGLWASRWEMPLIVVVLAAFALGVAAGALAMVLPYTRMRRELQELRRQRRKDGSAPLDEVLPDRVEPAAPLDAVL
ncbi:LapA family protein [Chitinimonas koreensis]|uniref:LapA family protein n=1 Tax=Chitinimonas koreensis TaxID=356302 RepID=UPI0003F907D5|nr:lipopolysaccharide assembly protein LapA domain-containing protein [Chitinimonas koreensis]QNM95221.1 DUF1049 domain-containing protein [Chitinimonas koreensis]